MRTIDQQQREIAIPNNQESTNMKPAIVTTSHRGVFYGQVPDNSIPSQKTIKVVDAKMAIYWGTTKGLSQLAATGPTDKSRISAPATVTLTDITAIFDVTDEAAKAWANA